jgi:hypothetical protein
LANSTVNTTRTASARSANRRSQPRTVSTGRPSHAAIARTPVPLAFAASAAPITSTRSARRARANTGSNTCVTPQPEHLDRRGRTRTTCVPGPRSTRATAQPQGASRCPHPGHPTSPAASRRSTEPASASTVSTAPPCATHGPPGTRPRDHREGHRVSDVGTLPPPTNARNPASPGLSSSAFGTPLHAGPIGIFKDAQHAADFATLAAAVNLVRLATLGLARTPHGWALTTA